MLPALREAQRNAFWTDPARSRRPRPACGALAIRAWRLRAIRGNRYMALLMAAVCCGPLPRPWCTHSPTGPGCRCGRSFRTPEARPRPSSCSCSYSSFPSGRARRPGVALGALHRTGALHGPRGHEHTARHGVVVHHPHRERLWNDRRFRARALVYTRDRLQLYSYNSGDRDAGPRRDPLSPPLLPADATVASGRARSLRGNIVYVAGFSPVPGLDIPP